MEKLSYKTFQWPHNPHTYREEFLREPQYHTSDGKTYYDGMGERKLTITGSGAFFGEEAYERFRELAALFEDKTPGDLVHPIWGTRYCCFTGLELTQEPKENYISYRFTFTGALEDGTIPK